MHFINSKFNKILNNSRFPSREKSHKIKFYYYAFISVGGLLISSVIFYLSISLMNITVFYANWIGDIVALSFVFLCSWMFIFDHSKKKLSIKFIFNLIAKLLVIYLISSTLYIISNYVSSSTFFWEFSALQRDFFLTFAKVILAPLSLLTNYVLTFIIIEKLFKG
jgi:putative flippase GtrA